MDQRLDAIEMALQRIEAKLDAISNSCSNMDDHIGFVEGVYEVARRPLTRLLGVLPRVRLWHSPLGLPVHQIRG